MNGNICPSVHTHNGVQSRTNNFSIALVYWCEAIALSPHIFYNWHIYIYIYIYMLSRILDVLNKYCHRKLLLYWLLCGWVFDEIAKCDHPFFLTKYKILSNNIWRYIQKSYTKGIILSEKYLFSTGGLGKKKQIRSDFKMNGNICPSVHTHNGVQSHYFLCNNMTWKAVFEKHIPMYIYTKVIFLQWYWFK